VQSRVKGFTLIELLVVIAIIAILAAILFPVFAKVREKARAITCSSNEKQMGLAIMQYSQDYDECYVPRYVDQADGNGQVWTQLIQPYCKSQHLFQCPSNPRKDDLYCCGAPGYTSYGANVQGVIMDVSYVPGNAHTPVTMSAISNPSQVIGVVESTSHYADFNIDWSYWWGQPDNGDVGCLFLGHTGTSNYLFMDGHVKAYHPFQTLSKKDGGSGDVTMWIPNGYNFTDPAGPANDVGYDGGHGETVSPPTPNGPIVTMNACIKRFGG